MPQAAKISVPVLSPVAALAQRTVLQRQCACGQHTGSGGECEECKKKGQGTLQRAAIQPQAVQDVPPVVHDVLNSPGQPLEPAARAYFERPFGQDFSDVRVHSGPRAAESAREVHARAYTVGPHMTFGEGQYQPNTASGRRLIAHELTHVVQQRSAQAVPQGAPLAVSSPGDAAEREAERISTALSERGEHQPVVERPVASLARAALDIAAISADAMNPVPKKFKTHTSGEVAKAADYPTALTLPKDKTKPVKPLPAADKKAPLSTIPVEAHFFPAAGPAKGRALMIGGFHGDEQPGWQVAEAMIDDLAAGGKTKLAFHTLIIPRLNSGAITDELAGVKMWHNRCNRQIVDLNRNFPTGNTPKDTDCVNTPGAPIQPEVQAVIDIIAKFKPDRILSTHAISTASGAGVFADPNQDPKAIELARGMASTLVNPSDRPHNKLGTGVDDFNPVYPLDTPGVVGAGTSLGAYGPTAIPGQTTPVITMEAPEFHPLGSGTGSDARTVEGFLRPVRAFLEDPADLATAADRDILADIDAFKAADRIAFLTGTLKSKDDIFNRIRFRIDTAIAKLNAIKGHDPIKVVSWLRLFSEEGVGGSSQSQIDFDKFFMTGGKSNGWDTLPDKFFKINEKTKAPDRKLGVDRAMWLATPSKDRLDIIIRFSSLPGVSRHHWGTEVDLNSTEVADWEPAVGKKPAGKFFALGQWLQANAPSVGLVQAYTSGRASGYFEEAWHYSYAPISVGLRTRYNKQVNLQTNVLDKVEAEFKQKAAAAKEKMPADFAAALKKINISDLIDTIGPGL